MNIVRGAPEAPGAAAGATRVPHDPQKANPGAIVLPQFAQIVSPALAGPAPSPAAGPVWSELPIGGVPASLAAAERGTPTGALVGGCKIGPGVNCAGILGESFQGIPPLPRAAALCAAMDGDRSTTLALISPEATATGGGVTLGVGAGTNSVRAMPMGGGVFSLSAGSAGARTTGSGVAAAPAPGEATAGAALASSFPQPRQNL